MRFKLNVLFCPFFTLQFLLLSANAKSVPSGETKFESSVNGTSEDTLDIVPRQEDEDQNESSVPRVAASIMKIFKGVVTGNIHDIFHGAFSIPSDQDVSNRLIAVYNQVVGFPTTSTTEIPEPTTPLQVDIPATITENSTVESNTVITESSIVTVLSNETIASNETISSNETIPSNDTIVPSSEIFVSNDTIATNDTIITNDTIVSTEAIVLTNATEIISTTVKETTDRLSELAETDVFPEDEEDEEYDDNDENESKKPKNNNSSKLKKLSP